MKTAKSSRQKLEGSGRKCINDDLEENLVIWIYKQLSKMIMFKVKKCLTKRMTTQLLEIRLLPVMVGVRTS